ncbi:hypothetical protein F2P81_025250 [Scophthalmus maximus]|uniref:Outer dense fiber protein 2 n=1 Tax=Scophthalmus maximus TaxID=52904 RepID=A0A6A4RVT9_SCOMX|nr:hypothetical protein F2P81_025250 [Scophthalmus maximus]
MKTRESPPPVHVHVPETTPVHVHMRRSPSKTPQDKRLSKLHAASVGRQQELLVEKMEMFDHTNQSLRELLREWSEHERDSLVWSEQRDALKKRLDHSETENIRLLAKFTNKEKEASKLAEHLDFEKDNAKTTEELSRILESTRDHLESQLDRAEAEKARLAAQIQVCERRIQHFGLKFVSTKHLTPHPRFYK